MSLFVRCLTSPDRCSRFFWYVHITSSTTAVTVLAEWLTSPTGSTVPSQPDSVEQQLLAAENALLASYERVLVRPPQHLLSIPLLVFILCISHCSAANRENGRSSTLFQAKQNSFFYLCFSSYCRCISATAAKAIGIFAATHTSCLTAFQLREETDEEMERRIEEERRKHEEAEKQRLKEAMENRAKREAEAQVCCSCS